MMLRLKKRVTGKDRTYGIEQQQHGATHWNRVENKVGRMDEGNKNKRKTHEERWHVTAYDGRRSGGAGSNGFGIESVVSDWVRVYRWIRRVDGHWHCLAL